MTSSGQPLEDLCEIITKGTTPTTLGMEFTEDGVPFVRVNNFTGEGLKLNGDTLFISHKTHAALSRSIIKGGDVLLSIAGTIGRSCVVPNDSLDLNCNQAVCIIRPKPGVLFNRYLQRWLTSAEALSQVADGKVTGVISNLSLSNVRGLRLRLPSWAEQKRIAAILDKADAIRRKRQQALRLTDDFLRSVFLDMFGDSVTNPKGWPEIEFGELVESTKLGMVRSSTEFGWDMPVPYVRMDALTNDGAFLPEKVQGTQATKTEIQDYGLNPGDFLFNTRNSKELVGKVAVYPGPAGTTFNNNLMRIRFKKSADPYFICQQFQFPRVQRELEARKQGTTSVFAVYWKNLQTLPILCPPPKLQKDFRCIVDKITTARIPMTNLAAESNDLFSSLQQRAFRGEL